MSATSKADLRKILGAIAEQKKSSEAPKIHLVFKQWQLNDMAEALKIVARNFSCVIHVIISEEKILEIANPVDHWKKNGLDINPLVISSKNELENGPILDQMGYEISSNEKIIDFTPQANVATHHEELPMYREPFCNRYQLKLLGKTIEEMSDSKKLEANLELLELTFDLESYEKTSSFFRKKPERSTPSAGITLENTIPVKPEKIAELFSGPAGPKKNELKPNS